MKSDAEKEIEALLVAGDVARAVLALDRLPFLKRRVVADLVHKIAGVDPADLMDRTINQQRKLFGSAAAKLSEQFLDEWHGGNLPLPFVAARGFDLYLACVCWARSLDDPPPARIVFLRTAGQHPAILRRHTRYIGAGATSIRIYHPKNAEVPIINLAWWFTQQVDEFAVALEKFCETTPHKKGDGLFS